MFSRASQMMMLKNSMTRLTSSLNTRTTSKYAAQIDYLKSAVDQNTLDWPAIKANVLSHPGNINEKNFEGVLLKIMVNASKFDAALSFANHLRKNSDDLKLGSINGLLNMYFEIGMSRKLSKEEKQFIIDSYKHLYEKYKVLDYTTCEKLLRALCVIDEWEKGLKVLEDIHLSSVPSHNAFSLLIGVLFKNNKNKKALELVQKSIEHKRPLQYPAFEEWINYILRKYKDKKVIIKHLDKIYEHISRNYAVVDEFTAMKLKETFINLGWDAEVTKLRKINGECINCKDKLAFLKLSEDEFQLLQQNVKEKLIVGTDLALKSSPEELSRFLRFIETTAPYDVVIDALNVAYAVGKGSTVDRVQLLSSIVDYFKVERKKVLLLGRRHMLKWAKGSIEKMKNTMCTFFTDDLSQDDPYIITAAILSGPHTDIVSKDLLRGHQFNLQDENLRYIFKKWQWQHQWMFFLGQNRSLKIQPPLTFTPCAQKNDNGGWHIPYQSEAAKVAGQFNDGSPDLSSWLCLQPKGNK